MYALNPTKLGVFIRLIKMELSFNSSFNRLISVCDKTLLRSFLSKIPELRQLVFKTENSSESGNISSELTETPASSDLTNSPNTFSCHTSVKPLNRKRGSCCLFILSP